MPAPDGVNVNDARTHRAFGRVTRSQIPIVTSAVGSRVEHDRERRCTAHFGRRSTNSAHRDAPAVSSSLFVTLMGPLHPTRCSSVSVERRSSCHDRVCRCHRRRRSHRHPSRSPSVLCSRYLHPTGVNVNERRTHRALGHGSLDVSPIVTLAVGSRVLARP